MAQASFAGGGGDDQERLLDEATSVVKEQAFYMKRAIDNDQVREALKHASNLICELRTSQLSPKNYYELYMQVFQEMQHLSGFFSDKTRHGRKMVDLYESVQHAGNILPRLYLLATVGASYIKSKEAPAKEILKDVNELCKGVQHPLRGLFLRYYLSQMLKDKLPDTGSGYEGEGGDIDDAFEFVFTNLNESNKLWVRIQHQSAVKDKQRREKERHDLRVLVGANLVRLSQLEGMTLDYYTKTALPRILEHVVSVKDTISQQYLLESMIQVFPDEFHIRTLEQLLAAYTRALLTVDMKPIMVALMERLARYMQEGEGAKASAGLDLFTLFRSHLGQILERALEPGSTPTPRDISAPLEVQTAFMQFTLSLYPGKVHYVDIILQSTVEILRKYTARLSESARAAKLGGPGAEKVVELLSCPLKTLSLSVLEMEHYPTLLGFLDFETRKQVAISMVKNVVEADLALSSVEAVNRLFTFIAPLVKDEEDTPVAPTQEGQQRDSFLHEQQQVCRLVHQIRNDDTDIVFQMLKAMANFFGQGGPSRLPQTLPPTFCAAMSLIPRIRERERRRAEAGNEGTLPAPAVTVKKVFQFMHKANSELSNSSPDVALQLWLMAAAAADQSEKATGNQGVFEPICCEFLTEALIVFEDHLSESSKQYQGVFKLVGTLTQITCLEGENFDNFGTKITQHAARLLKKPLQCRAVASCSHLFWCEARRDGKRVLECMQKCLKISDAVVQSDPKQVGLWVEMLDHYVYYVECECEEVTTKFVESLVNLCFEHVAFAENDSQSQMEAAKARGHLKSSLAYLRSLKSSSKPEVAARFAELSLPSGNPSA